jgi:hypothetical protein
MSPSRTAAPGFLLFAALIGAACQSGSVDGARAEASGAPGGEKPSGASATTPANGAAKAEASAPGAGSASNYGAAFAPGPEVPLASLLANPAAYTDQNVITQGKVHRACTRKGCWMEIGEGPSACRITFKDYGFFVPTDSAGAHARVQGRLDIRVVPKADVDHLEGEGARFEHKQPDGTATEIRLIASAVQLTR